MTTKERFEKARLIFLAKRKKTDEDRILLFKSKLYKYTQWISYLNIVFLLLLLLDYNLAGEMVKDKLLKESMERIVHVNTGSAVQVGYGSDVSTYLNLQTENNGRFVVRYNPKIGFPLLKESIFIEYSFILKKAKKLHDYKRGYSFRVSNSIFGFYTFLFLIIGAAFFGSMLLFKKGLFKNGVMATCILNTIGVGIFLLYFLFY